MPPEKKIKNHLDSFRKDLEELYTLYMRERISYFSLKKKIETLSESHKKILFQKDIFTNNSIIINLSKTRKIIKSYINIDIIEGLRKKGKVFLFLKSKEAKELKNIKINDLEKINELIEVNKLKMRLPYFEYFLDFFKFPKWLTDYAHNYKINKVNSYRREQRTILINTETYIKIIELLITQDRDIRLKFYGVIMATGRRPAEILKISTFALKDKDHIEMDHIAKKREGNSVNSVVFPVFADPVLIISTINEIRYMEQTDKFSREFLATNLAFSYNRLFKQIFKDIFDSEESLYFCRALYSKFSYINFAPKNMEVNFWITTTLGHEESDIITAFHYNRYIIENNSNDIDTNLIQLIKSRIYTYIKRKSTYSIVSREKIKQIIQDNKVADDNFMKTIYTIQDIMEDDKVDELEMLRGLNVRIRKIFKKKYGYNYNYIKLTEYLAVIFGYNK